MGSNLKGRAASGRPARLVRLILGPVGTYKSAVQITTSSTAEA